MSTFRRIIARNANYVLPSFAYREKFLQTKFDFFYRVTITDHQHKFSEFQNNPQLLQKNMPGFVGLWTIKDQNVASASICEQSHEPFNHYFDSFQLEAGFHKQKLTPFLIHEFLLAVAELDHKKVRVWPSTPQMKLACYTMDQYGWSSQRLSHHLLLHPSSTLV